MKICLDPGHSWDYNRGAYKEYYESNKMYELAGYLAAELKKYGFEVCITKKKLKENPDLTTRGKFAMTQKADIMLSLHSNACGSESVNTMNVYGSVATQQHDQLGILLADGIQALVKADGVKIGNVGIYHKYNSAKTDYYGILRCSVLAGSSVKAAYILEHGFHTNTAMSKWLCDSSNLQRLAIEEAKIIAQYCAKDGGWYQAFDTNYSQYIISSGDTWSKIAQSKLGKGTRYPEIQKYNGYRENYTLSPNFGLRIPKKAVNTQDKTVLAGKKLVTGTVTESVTPPTVEPTPAPNAPGTATSGDYVNYIVQKGDSWWKIAQNKMGSGAKCNELAAFNGMKTTTTIYAGQVLKIPTDKATAAGYKVYTVVKGDSWWKIAQNQMGAGAKYVELAAYNGLKTTSVLQPGQILHIPLK